MLTKIQWSIFLKPHEYFVCASQCFGFQCVSSKCIALLVLISIYCSGICCYWSWSWRGVQHYRIHILIDANYSWKKMGLLFTATVVVCLPLFSLLFKHLPIDSLTFCQSVCVTQRNFSSMYHNRMVCVCCVVCVSHSNRMNGKLMLCSFIPVTFTRLPAKQSSPSPPPPIWPWDVPI